nr:DUF550 domain-containing protein [Klebsiella pneumoniae]
MEHNSRCVDGSVEVDARLFESMLMELQERRKAAMGSEPVAVVEPSDYVTAAQLVGEGPAKKAVHELYEGALRIGDKLYRHAQPAPERDQVRSEHAEWSQATFGNVGPIGPLKHLRREVLEAIAKPYDLIEWADMQFLLWDAQRRAGITDEQITKAMIEKLAVNKQREWPAPKDGEPRLHIKEQPAPVVLDNGREQFEEWMLKRWGRERRDDDFAMGKFIYGEDYADSYTRCVWKAWSASRAAMLNGGKP